MKMTVIEIYPVKKFWSVAEVTDGIRDENTVIDNFTSKNSAIKFGRKCAQLNNLLAVVLDDKKIIQHGFDFTSPFRPASALTWYTPAD